MGDRGLREYDLLFGGTMKNLRELLIDFGLPALILVLLFILLLTGIDGEVKTLMAATIGWIIRSGVVKRPANPT